MKSKGERQNLVANISSNDQLDGCDDVLAIRGASRESSWCGGAMRGWELEILRRGWVLGATQRKVGTAGRPFPTSYGGRKGLLRNVYTRQ
jgi:hypothetical protein